MSPPKVAGVVAAAIASESPKDDSIVVYGGDVVPAFTKKQYYEIPDTKIAEGWTSTDPTIHAEKATAAHAAFKEEWKGIVRMVKRWNREKDKPVKPSFLLEVTISIPAPSPDHLLKSVDLVSVKSVLVDLDARGEGRWPRAKDGAVSPRRPALDCWTLRTLALTGAFLET